MYVSYFKDWLLFLIVVCLYSTNAYSYTVTINGGQSHYRLENDQTGIASEYLFNPAYTFSADVTFQMAKYHDIELYADYTRYSIDAINVPLPINKTSFSYLKWGFQYYAWFYSGFGLTLGGGGEAIPLLTIAPTAVSFEKYTPFLGDVGLVWRAKNQISTLELGYKYKHIFFSDIVGEGFSNTIYMVVDFGRRQPIKRTSEVYYVDHQYEGNFGIKFKYENTTIQTTYETTIDERLVEVYFRMRFSSDVF